MAVKRIVPNIGADHIAATTEFYVDILDMTIVMDLGWIMTLDD